MEGDSAMERLQELQRDLVAFTDSRLGNLDRLAAELEGSVNDLRNLLRRNKRNDKSRTTVNPASTPRPDTIKLGDGEYRITEDFRQATLQVADELDLDELEAAQLCLEAGAATVEHRPDTALPYRALLQFQNRRYIELDCIRLLLLQTMGLEAGDEVGVMLQEKAQIVVRGQRGHGNGSAFWRQCMAGLAEIEEYLSKIADHSQMVVITEQPVDCAIKDALAAQRLLLTRQHECLGAIMTYLIRCGYVDPSDFQPFVARMASLESSTDITLHYLPVLISGCACFGGEGGTTSETAKDLHRLFAAGPTQLQWKQSALKAAATIIWLSEYTARFADPTQNQILRVADRQEEEQERTDLFFRSAREKGLHYLLAACQFLRPEIWHDPAKLGLVRFLLDDFPPMTSDIIPASREFASMMMSQVQVFSDAFITNMPDILRRLQLDEDERRRTYFSGSIGQSQIEDFNLERFFVLMSYAFQGDVDAAQDFWSDRESNLYGFLQWASKRLPTPRVAAFCELLRSIANDEKSGNQAHLFLLEDTTMIGGKLRRTYAVSWAQIFSELELYASRVKGKPAQAQQVNPAADGGYIEPETSIMLEAYIRLAAHVCRLSPDARHWILREQTFHLGETVFQLASTGNEARVHAVCFDLLSALLTDKIEEVNSGMWVLLDNWISGGGPAAQPSTARQIPEAKHYLQNYASNAETATGLVNLLNALITPTGGLGNINDGLPFPENLGDTNRSAHAHGIEAYVDFVLGPVFRSTLVPTSADRTEVDVLRCACLEFVTICMGTFNENLIAISSLDATKINVDGTISTSSLAAYVRLHPFARAMEWVFNNNVITALMQPLLLDPVDELASQDFGSPRMQAALRSVQVMNLAMTLQATYLDLVRPLLATQRSSSGSTAAVISNAALGSYDDVLLSQLPVVATIASYMGSSYTNLALESIALLEKLCASRKLGGELSGGRVRLVGSLSDHAEVAAEDLKACFQVFEHDLDLGEQPPKLIRARAVVDLLNGSLDAAPSHPTVAHLLLGFNCETRSVLVSQLGAFAQGTSLFHTLAAYAAQSPYAIETSNISWLLSVKRGCWDIVMKLAMSSLTSALVLPELRAMDFFAAACQNQLSASVNLSWDGRALQDDALLLDSGSTDSVRGFLDVRKRLFEFASLDLRAAIEQDAYSIQEKTVSALLGHISLPDGSKGQSISIFELSDLFDLETPRPSEVTSFKFLQDSDLRLCTVGGPDGPYDLAMAELLLTLRKREMLGAGAIKESNEEQALDDEIRAVLASLTSQNSAREISNAHIRCLEAWTDLLSLMASISSPREKDVELVISRGLQVTLPRFEKALLGDFSAAALLAKLTLTLATAAHKTGRKTGDSNFVRERLLATFRVCLKAITDSGTELALRDVAYRACCEVHSFLASALIAGHTKTQKSGRHQLLALLQGAGLERIITVVTEDSFSDRGITRVSSLLFLGSLLSLSVDQKKTTMAILRMLNTLNFIPVLLDSTIGSIGDSFQMDNEELATSIAFFHTALSLFMRMVQTSAEGSQMLLNAGFLTTVRDSRLFSTDPDIGLDIDNPLALREFYRLLSAVLRVITALVVVARGAGNLSMVEQAKSFLKENRFSMMAVFKRVSNVQKTAGPPEEEARSVAGEFEKLICVCGFLEVSTTRLYDVALNGAR